MIRCLNHGIKVDIEASRHTFPGFGKAAPRELFFHFGFSEMEKGITGNYFEFLEVGCGENQACVPIFFVSWTLFLH